MEESNPQPRIKADITISPTTHSFANPDPPTLSLILTLQHPSPITIYADTASPASMLLCNSFNIHDLTTDTPVYHTKRTCCRFPPPRKIKVELHEKLFYTLYPDTPLSISARFGRQRKPLHKEAEGFEEGLHGPAACGVDGLEIGHSYLLSLSEGSRVSWTFMRWWEYGTQEEVLKGKDGKGLDGREVKFKKGPQQPIHLDKSGIKPITFDCIE